MTRRYLSYELTRNVIDGLMTFGEVTDFVRLDVIYTVAQRRYDAQRRAEFMRLSGSVPVPRKIDELDLLRAVAEAVDEHDALTRSRRGYVEAVARGDDPETGFYADNLGHATVDMIAAVLMGVGIEEDWKLRYKRRVVAPLGRMLRAGLVCRGERNGQPYGYELTDDGAEMLSDAGLIEALA